MFLKELKAEKKKKGKNSRTRYTITVGGRAHPGHSQSVQRDVSYILVDVLALLTATPVCDLPSCRHH